MTLPKRCSDPKECTSPKRQGCTVKAMQQQLRGQGVPDLWRLRKPELCKLIAERDQAKQPKRTTKSNSSGDKPPRSITKKLQEPFLWGSAKYVSGPVSVTVFETPRGQRVYVFGDEHSSTWKQCWHPNSASIFNLFDKACKEKSRDVDVFLEATPPDQEKAARYRYKTLIFKLIKKYMSEIHHYKNTKRCAARFHWADSRRESALSVNIEVLPDEWAKHVDTSEKLRSIVHAGLTAKPSLPAVKAIHPKIANLQRPKETKAHDTHDKLLLWENTKVYPSSKQFNKLSPQDQRHVRKFINDYLSAHDVFGYPYYDNFAQRVNAGIKNEDINRYLFFLELEIGALDMDVYLLSRLLNYIHKQKDGGVTLVFAGDFHCQNYRHVMKAIWGKPVFHRSNLDSPQSDPHRPGFRCVDVLHGTEMEDTLAHPNTASWMAYLKKVFSAKS